MTVRRHPLFFSSATRGIAVDLDLAERLERSARLFGDPAERLVPVFYRRLFRRAPELVGLFPPDLSGLEAKFAATLATIINHLREPEELRRPLRELGKRHVGYGVRAEHYPIVAEELLAAMAEVAGQHWTSEANDDWRLALEMIVRAMLGE